MFWVKNFFRIQIISKKLAAGQVATKFLSLLFAIDNVITGFSEKHILSRPISSG
ncbi:MAG: hypothetical protein OFPI_23450 [Osedax symbiont Rs2]|nr:MAG: hypothetical protein OFPI_23450 [Osedax symbiont Rs2]